MRCKHDHVYWGGDALRCAKCGWYLSADEQVAAEQAPEKAKTVAVDYGDGVEVPLTPRQHVSDAAWKAWGISIIDRDSSEANHRKYGTMCVTVEEWEARGNDNDFNVSFDAHQETIGQFQNEIAQTDAEIEKWKTAYERANREWHNAEALSSIRYANCQRQLAEIERLQRDLETVKNVAAAAIERCRDVQQARRTGDDSDSTCASDRSGAVGRAAPLGLSAVLLTTTPVDKYGRFGR